MSKTTDSLENTLAAAERSAVENTRKALAYMEQYGIRPEGRVQPFLPPETRATTIDVLPYAHKTRQQVSYETAPGEFSALCPFSGLPDYGTVTITYTPGSHFLELKSLKYYLISWRTIGAAQEDITAYLYEDLRRHLPDAEELTVTTKYNVRGGIETVCRCTSNDQR